MTLTDIPDEGLDGFTLEPGLSRQGLRSRSRNTKASQGADQDEQRQHAGSPVPEGVGAVQGLSAV